MKKIVSFLFVLALFAPVVFHARLAQAATPNLIANPSMETAGAAGRPQSWLNGGWGQNNANYAYPVAGFDGAKAAKVTITQFTSGDAKWYFQEVPVTPGITYSFSDTYTSTVNSQLVVQFHLLGTKYGYLDLGNVPASSTWKQIKKSFTVPVGASAATVFHLIHTKGSLTTDAYSLTQTTPPDPTQFETGLVTLNFDDGWVTGYSAAFPKLQAAGIKGTYSVVSGFLGTAGYMTAANVSALHAAGQEIGSHSQTHPFLTQLTAQQMQTEISGSKTDLMALGVSSVSTFAYPYGDYSNVTDTAVKAAGYSSARSSDLGFNKRNGNRYNLQIQSVEINTSVAQVKAWIDQAAADKSWLILLFHQIDTNGGQYSITPNNFQQVVNYLVQQHTAVVTTSQGVAQMQ